MRHIRSFRSLAVLVFALSPVAGTPAQTDDGLSMKAGPLRLDVDKTGRVTALVETAKDLNHLASQPSFLMECQKYGVGTSTPAMRPKGMRIVKKTDALVKVELLFEGDLTLTVEIAAKSDYLRMELVDARPVDAISHVTWGPYKTSMRGPIGEWLGVNRSDDFTIGLMSLEPNTDGKPGYSARAACFQGYGSSLELWSLDRTRPREYAKLRMARALPGVTVVGSAAALYGTPRGKRSELDRIERIELAEKLPHPLYHGKWAKRSREVQKPCIWTQIDQKNVDACIRLGKQLGAGTLCRFHGFFRNWGHFEIHPKVYPGGLAALRADSRKAREQGLGLTGYTLTGFLKPQPDREPYLAPVPDARLQTWTPTSALVEDLDRDGPAVAIRFHEDLNDVLKHPFKVIRVGDELIEFKTYEVRNGTLRVKDGQRGAFHTAAAPHARGDAVTWMYVSGYHNFYPGTVDMNNEVAATIGRLARDAELGKVVLDGYESCYETGHGDYAQNLFLWTIYDLCDGRNVLYATSLTQGNYNWHMISYQSWGEYDLHKGFRGTMLDYRLQRQVQLRRNRMPNKLGQYYPNKATREDLEWLMALAAGWESGVDLHVGIAEFPKNPEFDGIAEAIRLWEQARLEDAFTAAQKMQLRQTDRLHRLARKPDGTWDLRFVRFWRHDGVNLRPPSSIKIEPTTGGPASVSPCGIDWAWTHNPAIYAEAGLSDDLVHRTGTTASSWKVTFPKGDTPHHANRKQKLLIVFRVPPDAPCAVRNLKVGVNNNFMDIPAILQPGQYLATPHEIPLAGVYDGQHRIIREVQIRQHNPYWYIPEAPKGVPVTINISCEPAVPAAAPEVRVNLRFHHEILPPGQR